jgi:predicted DNA binding CopG/RHH family protein
MMKLDEYEKELLELDEAGKIQFNKVDPEERSALMAAARETLQKDKRINIRMSGRDLLSLKRKANRFGMPYQTLISSILHQYVSGDLKPTLVEEVQSSYSSKTKKK